MTSEVFQQEREVTSSTLVLPKIRCTQRNLEQHNQIDIVIKYYKLSDYLVFIVILFSKRFNKFLTGLCIMSNLPASPTTFFPRSHRPSLTTTFRRFNNYLHIHIHLID
ncbi:FKBP12-rapamycin complex-associated protein [Fusarium oxysporum f. sp. albedinis]|nr:FKBP12-rapamycin complex-associated protein [Fusarium oxysporum f. sp. albedinis]